MDCLESIKFTVKIYKQDLKVLEMKIEKLKGKRNALIDCIENLDIIISEQKPKTNETP